MRWDPPKFIISKKIQLIINNVFKKVFINILFYYN